MSDIEKLRCRWERELGFAPSKAFKKEFLERALEYHAQVKRYGGLDWRTDKELCRIARKLQQHPTYIPRSSRNHIKVGVRIRKVWNNEIHEVEVLDKGFFYRDQTFRSLSAVANHITGTTWNGLVFFGMKKDHRYE